jgi:hypothetical protein
MEGQASKQCSDRVPVPLKLKNLMGAEVQNGLGSTQVLSDLYEYEYSDLRVTLRVCTQPTL